MYICCRLSARRDVVYRFDLLEVSEALMHAVYARFLEAGYWGHITKAAASYLYTRRGRETGKKNKITTGNWQPRGGSSMFSFLRLTLRTGRTSMGE